MAKLSMTQAGIEGYLETLAMQITDLSPSINIGSHSSATEMNNQEGVETGSGPKQSASGDLVGETSGHAQGNSQDFLKLLVDQQKQMFDSLKEQLQPRFSKQASSDMTADSAEQPASKRPTHEMLDEETGDKWDSIEDQLEALGGPERAGESADEDVLEDIREFFVKKEKLEPNLSQPTADVLTAALRALIPQGQEQEILERVLSPANCDRL